MLGRLRSGGTNEVEQSVRSIAGDVCEVIQRALTCTGISLECEALFLCCVPTIVPILHSAFRHVPDLLLLIS